VYRSPSDLRPLYVRHGPRRDKSYLLTSYVRSAHVRVTGQREQHVPSVLLSSFEEQGTS